MTDYIVKDISLADFGRKELDIAETEMPGLMWRMIELRQKLTRFNFGMLC